MASERTVLCSSNVAFQLAMIPELSGGFVWKTTVIGGSRNLRTKSAPA